MSDFTFRKQERLKSKKILNSLFEHGSSFTEFPIRVVWQAVESTPNEFPIQIAFSVPKKKYPKAVDRNKIKRKIREAYRLNKHVLYENLKNENRQFALMFIYLANDLLSYEQIDSSVKAIINKLILKFNKEL